MWGFNLKTMNVDFLKQPIKVGDHVACLDMHHQNLRLGLIVRINDKTILVAPFEQGHDQRAVINAFKAGKPKAEMYSLNGSVYRTLAEAVVIVPKEQITKINGYSDKANERLVEFVMAYNHYRPEKPVSKGKKKSALKI